MQAKDTVEGLTYNVHNQVIIKLDRPIKPSFWNKGVHWNPIPYEKQDAWAAYDTRQKKAKQMLIYNEYAEERKIRKKRFIEAGREDELSASEDEYGNFKTGYEQTDFMKKFSSAVDDD